MSFRDIQTDKALPSQLKTITKKPKQEKSASQIKININEFHNTKQRTVYLISIFWIFYKDMKLVLLPGLSVSDN